MSGSCRGSYRANIATMEGRTDYGSKWKSSNSNPSVYRSRLMKCLSGIDNNSSDTGKASGNEIRRKADESLQTVMYLNCWAQS